MKFFKLLKFDLLQGIIKEYKKYIFFILLVLLACSEFSAVLRSFDEYTASCGDFLLYIYGGMCEYIPVPGIVFEIPYLWLINHILILYFTLNYMNNDLSGFGQQVIFRSKNRFSWWLSKCLWQVAAITTFYFISWVTIYIYLLIDNKEISFKISDFMPQIMGFGIDVENFSHTNLNIEITVLPLLFTVCLGLFQMTLCLFIKPIFSYVISCIVCVSSAYYLNPLFLGNYSMAIRNDKLISNGVNTIIGSMFIFFIGTISVVIGLIKFQKHNILYKE